MFFFASIYNRRYNDRRSRGGTSMELPFVIVCIFLFLSFFLGGGGVVWRFSSLYLIVQFAIAVSER